MTAINPSATAEEVAVLVAVEYAREVLRQARDDTGVTCQISRALLTEHARASALAEQVEALRAALLELVACYDEEQTRDPSIWMPRWLSAWTAARAAGGET